MKSLFGSILSIFFAQNDKFLFIHLSEYVGSSKTYNKTHTGLHINNKIRYEAKSKCYLSRNASSENGTETVCEQFHQADMKTT